MRSRDLCALTVALCLTLSVAGCAQESNLALDLPRGQLSITRDGDKVLALRVTIADDPEERNQGLRGIGSLPRTQGMVFLWPEPVVAPFFMEDTLIPLQIASWDASNRIVSIMRMVPCRSKPCPLYESGKKIVGAVEVADGVLDEAAVVIGDRIVFSPDERPGRR